MKDSSIGDRIGWSEVIAIREQGGVVDGVFKNLAAAVAYAARGWRGSALAVLHDVPPGGLSGETAWAAALLLLSSRGTGPFDLLASVLTELSYPDPGRDSGRTIPFEDALSSVSSVDGVPEWAALLSHHAPKALSAYVTVRTNAWSQQSLPEREVHLILTLVNVVDGKPAFAARHASLALAAGASAQTVVEVAALSIEIAGITSWFESAAALAAVVGAPA